MSRTLPLFLALLALVIFVSAPLMGAEAAKNGPHHGTVVKAGDGKLTLKGRSGKEREVDVAADAKITCDGKECKLENLKAGTKLTFTLTDKKATKIDGTTTASNNNNNNNKNNNNENK